MSVLKWPISSFIGSYFARDAKYSHNYTGDSSTRCMFICRVLVGDHIIGNSSYLRPPSKDGGDAIFYDSCVDNPNNPSIFVVFEKHQIYPEYLVKYQDESPLSSSSYRPATAINSTTVPKRVATIQPAPSSYTPKPVTYSSSSYSTSIYKTPKFQPAASTYNSNSSSDTYSSPAYSANSYSYPTSTPAHTRKPSSSKSDNSCIIS